MGSTANWVMGSLGVLGRRLESFRLDHLIAKNPGLFFILKVIQIQIEIKAILNNRD